jgi:hypothetical protein
VADEEFVGGGHAGDVPRGRRYCGSRYCAAAPCDRTFSSAQGAVAAAILPTLLNLVLGFIIGAIVVAAVKLVEKMRGTSH